MLHCFADLMRPVQPLVKRTIARSMMAAVQDLEQRWNTGLARCQAPSRVICRIEYRYCGKIE